RRSRTPTPPAGRPRCLPPRLPLLGSATAAIGLHIPPLHRGPRSVQDRRLPVRQEGTRVNDTTPTSVESADLAAKRLPELQTIAAGLGIKGARRLRKNDWIEAIRGSGSASPRQQTQPQETTDAPQRPALGKSAPEKPEKSASEKSEKPAPSAGCE